MAQHMSTKFTFALSRDEPVLTPGSDLWSAPLPVSRNAFNQSRTGSEVQGPVSYGDYFMAAQQFLSKDRFALLCRAASHLTGTSTAPADIDQVAVHLVKHGAFYHPAHIVAAVHGRQLSLVLNAAVSPEGRKVIDQECRSLIQLNDQRAHPFWPTVFGIGVGADSKDRPIPMFLGQWLDGYHEFHLSGDDPDHRHVVLWDTRSGHRTLDRGQVMEILRQSALILTYAYNPLTFEAIRQWHHAAGDFIVAVNDDGIALRLITVRNYSPIFENDDPDVAAMLEGLLVFLVEISLKLRLDRLDGVGDMVCHGEHMVGPICEGFFQGLRLVAPEIGLPEDFDETVREFIALHQLNQLEEVASAIIQNLSAEPDERDLLQDNLESHLPALLHGIHGKRCR